MKGTVDHPGDVRSSKNSRLAEKGVIWIVVNSRVGRNKTYPIGQQSKATNLLILQYWRGESLPNPNHFG